MSYLNDELSNSIEFNTNEFIGSFLYFSNFFKKDKSLVIEKEQKEILSKFFKIIFEKEFQHIKIKELSYVLSQKFSKYETIHDYINNNSEILKEFFSHNLQFSQNRKKISL